VGCVVRKVIRNTSVQDAVFVVNKAIEIKIVSMSVRNVSSKDIMNRIVLCVEFVNKTRMKNTLIQNNVLSV